MTPERKQAILSIAPNYRALYYGQRVLILREGEAYPYPCNGNLVTDHDGYLSLRSVESLTEEEKLKFMGLPIRAERDYLRSRGVVTPYCHPSTGVISIEEIIKAGIVVINPNPGR